MITLYTFGPAFGLPDPSPFVVKADVLLKMSGIDYSIDNTVIFKKSPKGKLPYIEDNGRFIGDSTFIRWHLEQKYHFDFDKHLSAQAKGIAWSVERLLEDNLYWMLVGIRWCDDANFARGPAIFFSKVPWLIRGLVKKIMRRQVAKSMKVHGVGLHSQQDILAIATKNIEAIAVILGDKPYLMGDAPCGADATCFAFIDGLLCPHFETPIRTVIEKHANLVNYAKRLRTQYYPEL